MSCKKNRFNVVYGLAVLLGITLFMGCDKKKNPLPSEDPETVFDKKGMLVNMADHLIIPSWTAFKASFEGLRKAHQDFQQHPGVPELDALRGAFDEAYLDYQRVSLFGFGPAEDQAIRVNFNIFPASQVEISGNISSGNYDLSTAANADAKGFPALDYLFYGSAVSDSAIIALLSTPGYASYINALIGDMDSRLSPVLAAWQGPYRETFVNSLGTDVGSSIGFMVNQINFELDYLKNAKLATPLGLRSGGAPLPGHCEAYHSARSMLYATETLKIIESAYLGRGLTGNNGLGFDDYLDHLGAQHTNGSLTSAITKQFESAYSKMQDIPDPLSGQVISSGEKVNTAYKELVKLLVLLKTDMPSNLGVVITYQDGDGD